MTTTIIEVLRRSSQGITKPFLCRGDDSCLYFVKGIHAGRRSQICEWIAGCLAKRLGLPIAPFEIVNIPEELLKYEILDTQKDLGQGYAFASLKQEVIEINFSSLSKISEDLQQALFAFDWWICNEDRTLSKQGGNPNLFLQSNSEKHSTPLIVIDHNLAFDLTFSKKSFIKYHIFRHAGQTFFEDKGLQRNYAAQFENVLMVWEEICTQIPKEWLFLDEEMTIPTDFDFKTAYQQLAHYKHPDFWTI